MVITSDSFLCFLSLIALYTFNLEHEVAKLPQIANMFRWFQEVTKSCGIWQSTWRVSSSSPSFFKLFPLLLLKEQVSPNTWHSILAKLGKNSSPSFSGRFTASLFHLIFNQMYMKNHNSHIPVSNILIKHLSPFSQRFLSNTLPKVTYLCQTENWK